MHETESLNFTCGIVGKMVKAGALFARQKIISKMQTNIFSPKLDMPVEIKDLPHSETVIFLAPNSRSV